MDKAIIETVINNNNNHDVISDIMFCFYCVVHFYMLYVLYICNQYVHYYTDVSFFELHVVCVPSMN